jgi:Protein of unknown function (DUF1559)
MRLIHSLKIDVRKQPGCSEQSGCCVHRPGVARLDVVVLLFLLVLLAGITITFVVRQRGVADRVHCSYNLEQLGKGVHEFDVQHKFLPPARIAVDYATWVVLIAPYMHRDHSLMNWDVSKPYAAQDAAIRTAYLKEMFCPARIRPEIQSTQGDGEGDANLPGTVGDYGCVSGDGRANCPWTGTKANGPMILGEIVKEEKGKILQWRGLTRLDQDVSLKRGLSVTLLLGEKHVPLDKWGRSDQGDGCVYNGRNPASSARIGGPGFGLAGSLTDPFNSNFGSYHPGVCLFLRADMSMIPFRNDVDQRVLGEMTLREED